MTNSDGQPPEQKFEQINFLSTTQELLATWSESNPLSRVINSEVKPSYFQFDYPGMEARFLDFRVKMKFIQNMEDLCKGQGDRCSLWLLWRIWKRVSLLWFLIGQYCLRRGIFATVEIS
jgi:hypothetical protein